jgi:hypothetical protein
MERQVTVGCPTNLPVDAIVDFLLDPIAADLWLGEGARLGGEVGEQILVPPATTGRVQQVARTHSSFTLRIAWDHDV